MKLVLHIGTEKTGTTTIQEFLYENRELLAENGYYVPKSLGLKNHRKLPSYFMGEERFDDFHHHNFINTVEEKNIFCSTLEKELVSEFLNIPSNMHTVIISSEHFHSRLIFQDEVDSIKELLSQFFDEFKIVVYLRRQIDVAISLYSTGLKSGNIMVGINDFVENQCHPETHYFNYEKFLSLWEHTFGSDMLEVRLFEKKEFYQNDLLLDFIHSVSVNLMDNIKGTFKQAKIKNESLTVFGQDILNIVNTHMPSFITGIGPNEVFVKLRDTVTNQCIGKGKQPDFEIAIKTMKRFSQSNKIIQERYFPNHNSLFDDSLEKFKQVQHITPEYELKVFEEVVKMLDTSITARDINKIRDIAISLEETDMKKAYELMRIANRLRPNGLAIIAKIKQYENSLYNKTKER